MLPPASGRITYSQGTLGPFPAGTSAMLTVCEIFRLKCAKQNNLDFDVFRFLNTTFQCDPGFTPAGQSASYCQNGAFTPALLGPCTPANGLNGGLTLPRFAAQGAPTSAASSGGKQRAENTSALIFASHALRHDSRKVLEASPLRDDEERQDAAAAMESSDVLRVSNE